MQKDEIIYDVLGIGNAIVDVLAKVGDGFLTERGLNKGSMTLLGAREAGEIYRDIIPEGEVSGGSAANTVAGLASLGADCAFIGKVHDDELGQVFKRQVAAAGIDYFTEPLFEGPATGRSIVLVTPDATRSMFTYLGASSRLTVDDIDESLIRSANVIFIEGYLCDDEQSKEAVKKAADIAHRYNRQVAFTLSDAACVKRHREELMDMVKTHVDILFANEEEILTLFNQTDFMKTLEQLKDIVELSAITRDSRGSVIVKNRIKIFVEAEKIDEVVDSTGAGDLYAAGFLYGMSKGRSLGTCAIIGSIAASEIIGHYGARPEVSLRGFVRNKLVQYGKRA